MFSIPLLLFENGKEKHNTSVYKTKIVFISCFIAFQLLFPFRYLCYPNELFWTEEGFRFSWRVMLMEKQDMQHLKLKMLLLKEITINNSHLPHFKKNKWLSAT
jgi:hypothetical protein